MRLPLAALTVMAALAPVPVFADWMTFVGRNIASGERTGLGARTSIPDQRPELAISCASGVLTATFDTGMAQPAGVSLADLPAELAVGVDGGKFDLFPVTSELYEDREGVQVRLRFGAAEALGLSQYVLGAKSSTQVSYWMGDKEVSRLDTSTDSAAISLGSVLSECHLSASKSK